MSFCLLLSQTLLSECQSAKAKYLFQPDELKTDTWPFSFSLSDPVVRVPLGQGQVPVPAGQVLRCELRQWRQVCAVRAQGGRAEAVDDVEGERHAAVRQGD